MLFRVVNIFVAICLFITSCSYEFKNEDYPPSDNILLVVTSDQLGSASLSAVDLVNFKSYVSFADGLVHTDAGIYYNNNRIYVVNRLGRDNIQVLNPYDNYSTVFEKSLKTDTVTRPNPHSIAFSENGPLYVSLYDSNNLLVLNSIDLQMSSSIDIGEYSFSEDKPCPSSLYYHEQSGTLYVALQRLDRDGFVASDYSLILTIDTVDNSVISSLKLESNDIAYTNPYSRFRHVTAETWHANSDSDKLLISCVGNFGVVSDDGVGDGAVLVYNLFSDGTFEFDTTLFNESTQYGDIVDILYCKQKLYMVTLNHNEDSFFMVYDPLKDTITVLENNSSNDAGYLWRIEKDSQNRIYLGDRNAYKPGIKIYDAAKESWVSDEVIDTGLPPYDLLIIE